ncbi:putative SDR family oxidoreductase [Paratrimastix pyriformis]|uniref:SDR family oxidoreductase n=1 Tax=Paratrimastix pyriformis TaxID=342808 RepID=A0ABQ8UHW3_9EUKA|nr:putative SDR family oxidoreductase [Paratrimastix pyriformis]
MPVINGYKYAFFSRRYLQSWLGGPRFTWAQDPPPCYIFLLQILLFLAPLFPGIAMLVIIHFGFVSLWAGAGICAAITACCRRVKDDAPTYTLPGSLSDEDNTQISGCCTSLAADYLVHAKGRNRAFWGHLILQAVVSAAIMYVTVLMTYTSYCYGRYGIPLGTVYQVFAWLSLLTAHYSLLATAPPEPSEYGAVDRTWLDYNRPFYLAVLGALFLAELVVNGPSVHAAPVASLLRGFTVVTHPMFACMVFLHPLGLVPSWDALLLWAFEQVAHFLFGAPPVGSSGRIVCQFLAGLAVCIGGVFLAGYQLPWLALGLYLLAAVGLSRNWLPASRAHFRLLGTEGRRRCWGSWTVVFTLVDLPLLVGIVAAAVVLTVVLPDAFGSVSLLLSTAPTPTVMTVRLAIDIALTALWALAALCGQLGRPYMWDWREAREAGRLYGGGSTPPGHKFISSSRRLCRFCGGLYRVLCTAFMVLLPCYGVAFEGPFDATTFLVCGMWVGLVMLAILFLALRIFIGEDGRERSSGSTPHVEDGGRWRREKGSWMEQWPDACIQRKPALVLHCMGLQRLLRYPLQLCSPTGAASLAPMHDHLLAALVWHLAHTIPLMSGAAQDATWLGTLTYPQLSLISRFLWDRACDLRRKFGYYIVAAISSVAQPKQRPWGTAASVLFLILTCPISLVGIVLSTAFGSPMLPLLGLPLFIFGFPRPLMHWHTLGSTSSASPESVLYETVWPGMAKALKHAIVRGQLDGTPGTFHLVRCENMLAWVQVVECWRNQITVSLKGLELQGTSCHNQEAIAVDAMLAPIRSYQAHCRTAAAPEGDDVGDDAKATSCVSGSLAAMLQPRTALAVPSYAPMPFRLSGIIEHPDNIALVQQLFMQSLAWVLAHASSVPTTEATKGCQSTERCDPSWIAGRALRMWQPWADLCIAHAAAQPSPRASVAARAAAPDAPATKPARPSSARRRGGAGGEDAVHAMPPVPGAPRVAFEESDPPADPPATTRPPPPPAMRCEVVGVPAWLLIDVFLTHLLTQTGGRDLTVFDLKRTPRIPLLPTSPPQAPAPPSRGSSTQSLTCPIQATPLPPPRQPRPTQPARLTAIQQLLASSPDSDIDSWLQETNVAAPGAVEQRPAAFGVPESSQEYLGPPPADLGSARPLAGGLYGGARSTPSCFMAERATGLTWQVALGAPLPGLGATPRLGQGAGRPGLRGGAGGEDDGAAMTTVMRRIGGPSGSMDTADEASGALEVPWFGGAASADPQLPDALRRLVLTCYAIVETLVTINSSICSCFWGDSKTPWRNGSAIDSRSIGGEAGPSHSMSIFQGALTPCFEADWLKERPELDALVHKAYRYAIKLLYDHTAFAPPDSPEELVEMLNDTDRLWFVGPSQSPQWAEALRAGRPNLFELAPRKVEGAVMAAVWIRRERVWKVGTLNPECVRGLWASLGLELLYFTNDDDERYSIQAHRQLLRNLTIQAAEPPLGYPTFASVGSLEDRQFRAIFQPRGSEGSTPGHNMVSGDFPGKWLFAKDITHETLKIYKKLIPEPFRKGFYQWFNNTKFAHNCDNVADWLVEIDQLPRKSRHRPPKWYLDELLRPGDITPAPTPAFVPPPVQPEIQPSECEEPNAEAAKMAIMTPGDVDACLPKPVVTLGDLRLDGASLFDDDGGQSEQAVGSPEWNPIDLRGITPDWMRDPQEWLTEPLQWVIILIRSPRLLPRIRLPRGTILPRGTRLQWVILTRGIRLPRGPMPYAASSVAMPIFVAESVKHPRHVYISGASSGIGSALALEYAKRGTRRLSLTGRNFDRLEKVKNDILSRYPSIELGLHDTRDGPAQREYIWRVNAMMPIDLVIANAGVGPDRATTLEDSSHIVTDVNYLGTLKTVFPALDCFTKRGRGQLAIVGSCAAYMGIPFMPEYCAAKAALATFAEGLRFRYGRSAIRVSIIMPGCVGTPMLATAMQRAFFTWTPARAARFIVRGLAADHKEIAFPCILAIVMRCWGAVPAFLKDACAFALGPLFLRAL